MNKNQINCLEIYNEVKDNIIRTIHKYKLKPEFYIVRGDEDYGSNIYMNLKVKTAEECGIKAEIVDDIRNGLGILQLPAQRDKIEEFNKKMIDVDYLDDTTVLKLASGLDLGRRLPATVKGVLEILKRELGDLSGKKIAVVGCRSKTVGRYLQYLLLQKNATVLLYHSKSKLKDREFEDCDCVISCVGVGGLISQKHFGNKTQCVCIDIGVSRGDDGKVCGDFNKDIREYQRYTPYVNGMGLLTRIFLMESVIERSM